MTTPTSSDKNTEKTLFPRCEVCGKSHFEIVCYGTPEFEDRIRKLIENIHTGHYDYDEWYDTQVCDLMGIIALSNHQAVQAFGEKVLKEKKIVSERPADGSMEAFSILAVPVSVITSLMNKETRR